MMLQISFNSAWEGRNTLCFYILISQVSPCINLVYTALVSLSSNKLVVAALPHGHVHYSLHSILIHRLQPNLPNPTNLSPYSAAQRKGWKRRKRRDKRGEGKLRVTWTEGAPRTAGDQGNTWTSRPCGNFWPPGCRRTHRRAWPPRPGWASRRTGTPGIPHR